MHEPLKVLVMQGRLGLSHQPPAMALPQPLPQVKGSWDGSLDSAEPSLSPSSEMKISGDSCSFAQ